MAKRRSNLSRSLKIAGILLILVALPITVIVSQKQQEIRQRADCFQKFTDVACESPHYLPSLTLFNCGVVRGSYVKCPLGSPCLQPYLYLTRGEAIGLITRYHLYIKKDWQLANPSLPYFPDVPTTSPFFREIETAKKYGLLFGSQDRNFKPAEPWEYGFKGLYANDFNFSKREPSITRGEFVKLMYAYSLLNDLNAVNKCSENGPITKNVPK